MVTRYDLPRDEGSQGSRGHWHPSRNRAGDCQGPALSASGVSLPRVLLINAATIKGEAARAVELSVSARAATASGRTRMKIEIRTAEPDEKPRTLR